MFPPSDNSLEIIPDKLTSLESRAGVGQVQYGLSFLLRPLPVLIPAGVYCANSFGNGIYSG